MKILNLFAGIGGNRKHWTGDITAVEINPRIADTYHKNYPDDKIIVTDAHDYLHDNYKQYDFIWASPPCQSHSKLVKWTKHDVRKYPDMMLYQEIILLKEFYKGQWVVENVTPYYKPMLNPTKIGRHLFWSNFYIAQLNDPRLPGFFNNENPGSLKMWLDIHYDGNLYYEDNHSPTQVLRNAVHPEIGRHIMKCAKHKLQFI